LQACKQNESAEESKEWMDMFSEYPLRPAAFLETHIRPTRLFSPVAPALGARALGGLVLGENKATCTFQPAVFTKYIHLKLLRANSEGWTGRNIDCQYFGALGQNITLDLLNTSSAIESGEEDNSFG